MQKNIPHDLLTYLILGKMADGPTYGYAIVKMLKEMSGGRWSISYGTVYGSMGRLEEKGFIAKTSGEPAGRTHLEAAGLRLGSYRGGELQTFPTVFPAFQPVSASVGAGQHRVGTKGGA